MAVVKRGSSCLSTRLRVSLILRVLNCGIGMQRSVVKIKISPE